MKLLTYCEFENSFNPKNGGSPVSYNAYCLVCSSHGFINTYVINSKLVPNIKSLVGKEVEILYKVNNFTKKQTPASVIEIPASQSKGDKFSL